MPPDAVARSHLVRGGPGQEHVSDIARKTGAFEQQARELQTNRSRALGHAKAAKTVVELEREVAELRATIATLSAAADAAAAPAPAPAPHPDPNSDDDPNALDPNALELLSPAPEPKYRKYRCESSKKRAVSRVRKILCEYPPADRPDLLARVMVTDGRGKGCGISVSLVKELLATPRMAQHMKQHAEAILTSAREHMMQHVFSASSLTSARRLLRLSYRKLDWLRRLLSHDGKTPRVMHPAYSTIVPSLPSTPDMKADEAVMLEQGGGLHSRKMGAAPSAKIWIGLLARALLSKRLGGSLHR